MAGPVVGSWKCFGPSWTSGHLSIIEKPEFTVEADLVETLDESDVAADVKLVLELRMHLEKHFALFDESKGCLLS